MSLLPGTFHQSRTDWDSFSILMTKPAVEQQAENMLQASNRKLYFHSTLLFSWLQVAPFRSFQLVGLQYAVARIITLKAIILKSTKMHWPKPEG